VTTRSLSGRGVILRLMNGKKLGGFGRLRVGGAEEEDGDGAKMGGANGWNGWTWTSVDGSFAIGRVSIAFKSLPTTFAAGYAFLWLGVVSERARPLEVMRFDIGLCSGANLAPGLRLSAVA
jgi:hypothetical protein